MILKLSGKELFYVGRGRHQAGRLDEAEEFYRHAIKTEPENAEAVHYLGMVLREQRRPAEGLEFLAQSVAMAGDRADFHFNYARALHEELDLEQAEKEYRRAVELDGTAVNARLNLGVVLHDLGRLEESAEVLGLLVVENPRLSAGWVNLARALAALGFEWESHKAINKALKGDADALTLVAASLLLLTLQDSRGAELACLRAVAMEPQSIPAWIQLGNSLAAEDRPNDAADAYERALQLEPGNRAATFFLAALGDIGGTSRPHTHQVIAPRESVRSLFDAYADRFDMVLVGLLNYQVPQLLERIFARWAAQDAAQSGSRVIIDAGCGTGLCGPWLAKYRGRLTGIDLSPGMIAKARARGLYDELVIGEVVEELQRRPREIDLIVAADVFVYFGDLAGAFAASAQALRPGGVLLFSVEINQTENFVLLPTQRFAHSIAYLERLAAANGFSVRAKDQAAIRRDKGRDIQGYLVLLQKT